MAVEVTTAELNEVLLDADVQALIVQKLASKKTEGLAEALTAQYKSLGIEPTDTESASSSSSVEGANESATSGDNPTS